MSETLYNNSDILIKLRNKSTSEEARGILVSFISYLMPRGVLVHKSSDN